MIPFLLHAAGPSVLPIIKSCPHKGTDIGHSVYSVNLNRFAVSL